MEQPIQASAEAESGTSTGAVMVLRDVTDERRLQHERAEQAEQLERIVEGIGEGLFVYDAQGRLVRTNAAARPLSNAGAAYGSATGALRKAAKSAAILSALAINSASAGSPLAAGA